MANNWGKWDAEHKGLGGRAADRLRDKVTRKAYEDTLANGGVTISLAGNSPTKGFAYSPYKGVETIVPKSEFSTKHIEDFVHKNKDVLSQKGNHIGMWEDEGNIYMDVSQVGPPNSATLEKAMQAKQLAAFDLGTFNEIPLGKMEGGVYTRQYEKAADHPYLNGGKKT